MTPAPVQTDPIAAYRDAVERHLADLLDDLRLDLLAGLRAHLADVAAELRPGETLEQRLGGPAQCASAVLGYSPALAHLHEEH